MKVTTGWRKEEAAQATKTRGGRYKGRRKKSGAAEGGTATGHDTRRKTPVNSYSKWRKLLADGKEEKENGR